MLGRVVAIRSSKGALCVRWDRGFPRKPSAPSRNHSLTRRRAFRVHGADPPTLGSVPDLPNDGTLPAAQSASNAESTHGNRLGLVIRGTQ